MMDALKTTRFPIRFVSQKRMFLRLPLPLEARVKVGCICALAKRACRFQCTTTSYHYRNSMSRGKTRSAWPFGLRLPKPSANMFAGHTMKYAKREFERRFLLRGEPPSLPPQYVSILDAYFVDTTLRLRRVMNSDGTNTVYKLTQKKKRMPTARCGSRTSTLRKPRQTLFRSLPSLMLEKRRYHIVRGAISRAIDIVEGIPEKLVLLEVEGDTAADIQDPPRGFDIVREVTHEEEYAGYAIAQRLAQELHDQ
jgi:CYTH domain-containing protein